MRAKPAERLEPAFVKLAAVLLTGVVAVTFDTTIVNVALPTIETKLHFSQSSLQWVITAYALTFGGFLLLGGRAADYLGRRRVFMVGIALFTVASLVCETATTETRFSDWLEANASWLGREYTNELRRNWS